ncbi:hypothetical protein BJV82DRAFT_288370 [Fennellomyces sp. T-0311]|nr:hypothetical protein BJV82DRAFT_288370 [Fennellomyces sp. T-0311]
MPYIDSIRVSFYFTTLANYQMRTGRRGCSLCRLKMRVEKAAAAKHSWIKMAKESRSLHPASSSLSSGGARLSNISLEAKEKRGSSRSKAVVVPLFHSLNPHVWANKNGLCPLETKLFTLRYRNMDQDHYGAVKFGEFRTYMHNKQAKLKDQEKTLEASSSQIPPQVFKGLSIYINGYTDPPQSELRRLIIIHGGDYQHYLKKSSVTHIIATNLTQAKCNEFRAYKVVKPGFIMDSIKQQKLLPWTEYRITGIDTAQSELRFQSNSRKQHDTSQAPEGKQLNASLLSNAWNRENTTVNPGFVKKYYTSSRLHHLSTWKSDIKAEIIRKLDSKFGKKRKRKRDSPRIVMHIDFDCFFASVGLLDRPQLKDKPVAVAHSQGTKDDSSSDIASCNYIARSFGVRNGMHIGAAKKLCPDLRVIPYEFEKYRAVSEALYEVLYEFAEEIEAVSVDEALIEVSDPSVATEIRRIIREKTRCEASIGIGSNILLARLGTKKAKPAGQFHCTLENLGEFSVSDLPRVGRSMTEKLSSMGITGVADLLGLSISSLQSNFGPKTGQMLYEFARGVDNRPLKHDQERQSVSADVNWGVRFENERQLITFMDELAEEVSNRLRNIERKGKRITINVLKRRPDAGEAAKRLGCGECDNFSKSVNLGTPFDEPKVIAKHSYDMLSSFKFDVTDIRGIGILINKLEPQTDASGQQKLSFASTRETSPKETLPVDLPSEIDPKVFAELPKDVQDELRRQYKIPTLQEPMEHRAGQDKAQPQDHLYTAVQGSEEQMPFAEPLPSLPDIPSWSQLDPRSLLALPEAMRNQVLEMYSNMPPKIKQDIIRPPTDGVSRDRQASPLKSKRSASPTKKHTTLTQMFHPTKNSEHEPTEHFPWHSSVWEELPL